MCLDQATCLLGHKMRPLLNYLRPPEIILRNPTKKWHEKFQDWELDSAEEKGEGGKSVHSFFMNIWFY